MKIELVLLIADDEGKPITTAGVSIQSPKTAERINRALAGIPDPLTAEDTITAIGRDLTSNPQELINAVANQLCAKLMEISQAVKPAEGAVSDGN
jgi:hypothetical protein